MTRTRFLSDTSINQLIIGRTLPADGRGGVDQGKVVVRMQGTAPVTPNDDPVRALNEVMGTEGRDTLTGTGGDDLIVSPHGVAMTKRVLWSNLESGSLAQGIDLEDRNQLLVRMTTSNLDEAIRARREGRKPTYRD